MLVEKQFFLSFVRSLLLVFSRIFYNLFLQVKPSYIGPKL